MNKLTLEQVQQRLSKKNIKLIGDYDGYKTITKFECLIDGYKWNSCLSEVIKKKCCPICSGKPKIITNEYIDYFLKDTNFKRLSDYKHCHKPINFLCLKHNEQFICNINALKIKIKNNYGCESCFIENKCKNNEYIDLKLKNTGIRRIGDYKGMNIKCEFEWIEDGYRWITTPGNVVSQYIHIKKNKLKRILNNDEIDKRIINRTIKRYSDMTTDRRCKFICEKCNNIWETNVYNILRGTDCPLVNILKQRKKLNTY